MHDKIKKVFRKGENLSAHFDSDLRRIMDAGEEEIAAISGFGEIGAHKVRAFFDNEENRRITLELIEQLEFEKTPIRQEQTLSGSTFVITGSLNHFENREALAAEIEKRGGKVSSSVSTKTSYLINNDAESKSSKNQKARQLEIPILTEDELLQMFWRGKYRVKFW